jgi:ribosomal protein L37E
MMEIRCERCGHLGPVKDVRPTAQGMALICAQCDHANIISASGAPVATAPPVVSAPTLIAPPVRAPEPVAERKESWLTPQALRRMVPEQGEGLRCRKCAHLIHADEDHCARCGLNNAESHRWPQGEAPWEKAPRGQEGDFEQATLLWRSARERWDEESVAKFAEFARDHGLHEMAIRHLRFWLVDEPEDGIALKHLKVLADALQSRYIVARAHEEVAGRAFGQEVGRLRGVLVLATLCFWCGIFVLFAGLFMDQCR